MHNEARSPVCISPCTYYPGTSQHDTSLPSDQALTKAVSKEAMDTATVVSLVVVSVAILVWFTFTPGAASRWSIQSTSPAQNPQGVGTDGSRSAHG